MKTHFILLLVSCSKSTVVDYHSMYYFWEAYRALLLRLIHLFSAPPGTLPGMSPLVSWQCLSPLAYRGSTYRSNSFTSYPSQICRRFSLVTLNMPSRHKTDSGSVPNVIGAPPKLYVLTNNAKSTPPFAPTYTPHERHGGKTGF